MPVDPARPPEQRTIPQLSRRSFCLALGVTLAIFFLLHPLWKPIDMDAMDRNIGWSYAPIPLLVLALLAAERKLRWSSWVLETIRLTLVKFAITFLTANLVWAIAGPPRTPAPPPVVAPDNPQPGRFDVREPPAPTPIDAARTGRITGLVVDDAGAPQAGVLVSVSAGLEGIVFAPGADVVLAHDGAGLQPPLAVVAVNQRLVLRGAADEMHTVRATDDTGRVQLNLPLLPGAERVLMFDKALGRLALVCTLHGASERSSEVAVVANPFAAWTGPDGAFRFDGVPAGELELAASSAPRINVRVGVSLPPGGSADGVRLVLP